MGIGGRLLRELAEIDDLERLRYTSHPLDMDEELMTAHRDIPALMPYLPSAGTGRIRYYLAAMNPAPQGRRLSPHY